MWLTTFKFFIITNVQLFSIIYSSDAMFETFFCVYQYVNERAAHVKINVIPVGVDLGSSNSLISHVVGWFSTTGVSWMKMKRLW